MEEVCGGVVGGDDGLLALEGQHAIAQLALALALLHHQVRAQGGTEAAADTLMLLRVCGRNIYSYLYIFPAQT